MFADDLGTFCIVFKFFFTSCYNSNVLPQFRTSNATARIFNRDRNFEVGAASRETIGILTLSHLIIFKVERPARPFRDVAAIWSFQSGLEITTSGARVSFRHPFTPNPLFASMLSMNWLGGGAQTGFVSGRGKPRYATAWNRM